MIQENKPVEASFRDNSGFVFKKNNIFYRQINHSYAHTYDKLLSSGLYEALIAKEWLIQHEELTVLDDENEPLPYYKIIQPEQLDFISYPSGWTFGMLKDAALLTLKIQKMALKYGMTLKDASAYNIQFRGSRSIFIDSLSFDTYTEGGIWEAYSQFCRHFLAPLALMAYQDVSLNRLLVVHLDGIPLDLASKLLPYRTRFNLNLYLHIHLQARLQGKYQKQQNANNSTGKQLSSSKLLQLIDSLESAIKKLEWKQRGTEWHDYYEKSVGEAYFNHKIKAVEILLEDCQAQRVLDLGANDGTFSQIAAQKADKVLSFDIDTAAVEAHYQRLKKEKNLNVTPYIIDVSNPEPAIGWSNTERPALWQRIDVDTIMALALIHHIRISNNTPLSMIADFFSQHCQNLIIEFVPKSDEKVKILLQNRQDIFDDYTLDNFKSIFSKHFIIEKAILLEPTERVLLLMKKHKSLE